MRLLVIRANHMAAVIRDEYILDDQLLAAGAGQTHHMPVVNNVEVLALNPERTEHGFAVFRHPTANKGTASRVVAAAGSQPFAVEHIAAFGFAYRAKRRVGRRHQCGVVTAPQLVAATRIEQTHFKRMHAQHHHIPGAGRTAACQLHQYPVQHIWVHLIATPAFRLQNLEKSGVLKRLDGFLWHHACLLAGFGAFAQQRNQLAGALDNLFFARLRHGGINLAHR